MRSPVVFALMCVGSCGSQPVPVTPAVVPVPAPIEPRQPVATLFGQVIDGVYKRQSRFELAEDTVYGWRIKLPCTEPTIFRETLQFPAPGDWTFDPSAAPHVKISADKTRAMIEDYSGCFEGWLQHAWTLAANDPPGEYVMTVEIEGYQPQVFRARFLAPEDFEKQPGRRGP